MSSTIKNLFHRNAFPPGEGGAQRRKRKGSPRGELPPKAAGGCRPSASARPSKRSRQSVWPPHGPLCRGPIVSHLRTNPPVLRRDQPPPDGPKFSDPPFMGVIGKFIRPSKRSRQSVWPPHGPLCRGPIVSHRTIRGLVPTVGMTASSWPPLSGTNRQPSDHPGGWSLRSG